MNQLIKYFSSPQQDGFVPEHIIVVQSSEHARCMTMTAKLILDYFDPSSANYISPKNEPDWSGQKPINKIWYFVLQLNAYAEMLNNLRDRTFIIGLDPGDRQAIYQALTAAQAWKDAAIALEQKEMGPDWGTNSHWFRHKIDDPVKDWPKRVRRQPYVIEGNKAWEGD